MIKVRITALFSLDKGLHKINYVIVFLSDTYRYIIKNVMREVRI